MKLNLAPTELIDQLRAWFHPKDRVVVIPTTLSAIATTAGATLATAFIQEQVLTASAGSITLLNIPQNFRTLILACQLRTDRAVETEAAIIRFNTDSGANYDHIFTRANSGGTTVTVFRGDTSLAIANVEAGNSRASNFTSFVIEILGYALTDREKWAACPSSGGFGDVAADTDLNLDNRRGRWRSTAAIKTISISPSVGPNFVSGSRVALYGIL